MDTKRKGREGVWFCSVSRYDVIGCGTGACEVWLSRPTPAFSCSRVAVSSTNPPLPASRSQEYLQQSLDGGALRFAWAGLPIPLFWVGTRSVYCPRWKRRGQPELELVSISS